MTEDREIKIIHGEADEIAHLIRRLSLLDMASRAKVMATVRAYYGMDEDRWPEELKAMQARMAGYNEHMKKMFEAAGTPPPADASAEERIEHLKEQMRRQGTMRRGIFGHESVPRDIELDEEEAKLLELVEDFGAAMFLKLVEKKREGCKGWNDDTDNNREALVAGLDRHIEKMRRHDPSNLVDIANFCAFIWNLRRKG